MVQVDYRQGDYRTVAERLLPAARRLVDGSAPARAERVVDVAAGSGNVAHLCRARPGRTVSGHGRQERPRKSSATPRSATGGRTTEPREGAMRR